MSNIKTKPQDGNYTQLGLRIGEKKPLQIYQETPYNKLSEPLKAPVVGGERNDFEEVKLKSKLQNNLNNIQKIQNENFDKKLQFIQEKLNMKRENDRMLRLMNLQKNYMMEGMVDELLEKMRLSETKRINQINTDLKEGTEELNEMIKQRKILNTEQFKEKPFIEREKIVEKEVEKIVEVQDPEQMREIGQLQERLRETDKERFNLDNKVKDLEKEKQEILNEKVEGEDAIEQRDYKIDQLNNQIKAFNDDIEELGKLKTEQKSREEEIIKLRTESEEKILSLQGTYLETEEERQNLELKVKELEDKQQLEKIEKVEKRRVLMMESRDMLKDIKGLTKELPLKNKILGDIKDFQRLKDISDSDWNNYEGITSNPLLIYDHEGKDKPLFRKQILQHSFGLMESIGINTDDLRQKLSAIPLNITQKEKQLQKVTILRQIQQRYNNYLLSEGVDSEQLEHDYLSQLDEYSDIIDTLKNKEQLKRMTPEFLKITLDEIKDKLDKPFFQLETPESRQLRRQIRSSPEEEVEEGTHRPDPPQRRRRDIVRGMRKTREEDV